MNYRHLNSPIALNPTWYWADFCKRSHQITQALKAQNIQSVALWIEDAAMFACAFLACINANAKILLPPTLLPENQQWISENADIFLNDETITQFGLEEIVAKDLPIINRASQTEIWMKTSGSSGEPKILIKTAEKMWQESDAIASSLPFEQGSHIHLIGSVSVQHHYGLSYRVMLPLNMGWTIARQQLQYPEYLIEESLTAEQSIWISSPALLTRINLDLPHLKQCKLQGILSSGGALPEENAEALRRALKCKIIEGYGSTETGVIAFREDNGLWQPTPVTQIGVNEEGALWVKNPWLTQTEQTADAVEIIDGQFKLLGRIDRIVKFGDKRISLVKIEQDLLKHQWVSDCYVAQHPHYQRPAAWVALTEIGIKAFNEIGRVKLLHQLKHYLTRTQEHAALPRFWRFCTELPRNSQSKISRVDFENVFLTQKDERF